jgi:hypothetical protein
VITEQIFSSYGLGRLTIDAPLGTDPSVIMAVTMLSAFNRRRELPGRPRPRSRLSARSAHLNHDANRRLVSVCRSGPGSATLELAEQGWG